MRVQLAGGQLLLLKAVPRAPIPNQLDEVVDDVASEWSSTCVAYAAIPPRPEGLGAGGHSHLDMLWHLWWTSLTRLPRQS